MRLRPTYEEWVSNFVKAVAEHFDFAGWRIAVEHVGPSADSTYAEAAINSSYLTCNIKVFEAGREDYAANKMDRLVTSLVHELTHVFLDPFHEMIEPFLSLATRSFFESILEQQTQKLTMVLLKGLPTELNEEEESTL